MTAKRIARPRPFILRRSAIHGKGVFAIDWIPEGTRLIEYTGERITHEESERRYPEEGTQPHYTLLFALNDGKTVIDATHGGNAARFINHSCEPSCEAVIEDGRIFIETLREIAPGEELGLDYNYLLTEPHTTKAKRRYPCRCGMPTCRGTLLGKKTR